MMKSEISIQGDRNGVRTLDIVSGSFRAILHSGTWGMLGEKGTQKKIKEWNKPKEGKKSGSTSKLQCPKPGNSW